MDKLDPTIGPSRFYFTLETTGALEPREVVSMACDQLAERLKKLKLALEYKEADQAGQQGQMQAQMMMGGQSVWGGQPAMGGQSVWGGKMGGQSVWGGQGR
jgi:hypothetical protein